MDVDPIAYLFHASLASEAKGCEACSLRTGRTNVVFGKGPVPATMMAIGEGPGGDEDRTGEPFVGPAGVVLDTMFSSMGLRRDEVYVTNLVKCRPPKNRAPLTEEVDACTHRWLLRQVEEIVKPEVILALGSSATRFFFGEAISNVHGTWTTWRDRPVFALHHPAHFIWTESQGAEVAERARAQTRRALGTLRDALRARALATPTGRPDEDRGRDPHSDQRDETKAASITAACRR